MQNLFTTAEAREFVQRIVDAIFVTGDVETVKRYYAADAVVHYGESLHNRDDIINRLNYCQAIYTEQQHFILDVVTFGNSIIFRDKQQGRSKENNEIFNVDLTAVYRIENNKVQESWLMTDVCFNYTANAQKGESDGITGHQTALINTNIDTAYKMFTQTIKKKLQRDYAKIELSPREMECLFYTLGGRTAKEIAHTLDLSARTIEHYLDNLKTKLNCNSKSELRRKLIPGGMWL